MTTVVITGVGSEGAYGVIRSLREYDSRIRIVGFDTNACTAHRRFVDALEVPPFRSSPEYLPFVIERLKALRASVCWPIPTDELELFAKERVRIEGESGARVMIGDECGITTANDKVKLYRHLTSNGIDAVAPFRVAHTVQELDEAIAELGYPARPVVIKPARGAGSQGFRILDGTLDRRREYFRRLALQQKSRWEDVRAVFVGGGFPEMLVTEYLPGAEWDVDVLADDGKVIALVTRQSHGMFGGMATDAEVKHNPEAAELATRITQSLRLSNINNIAFKGDAQGALRLLEINPRVPGTIIAATRAGVNLPAMALARLLGREMPRTREARHVRLVRYWDDVVLT